MTQIRDEFLHELGGLHHTGLLNAHLYAVESVRAHGAKLDGITDDTQAFERAIRALAAAPSDRKPMLLVGRGKALISPLTAITMRGLTVVGEGRYSTIIKCTGVGAHFKFDTLNTGTTTPWYGVAQDYMFKNIRFETDDALLASEGTRTRIAIQDNGSGSGHIEGCQFFGFQYGFQGTSGSDFTIIDDCVFSLCDVGVYFGPGSEQVSVSRTLFYNNAEGMVVDRAPQGSITNCWTYDQTTADFVFEANSTSRSGVSATMSGALGEYMWGVENCWFESNAAATSRIPNRFIYIKGNTADVLPRYVHVRNSFVIAGGAASGARAFMEVQAGTRHTVENTTFYGNAMTYCVKVTATVGNTAVVQKNTRALDGYAITNWGSSGGGSTAFCRYYDDWDGTMQGAAALDWTLGSLDRLVLGSGGILNGSVIEKWGTGSPEGVVTAPVSSVFHRTDGGASTSLYIKESGVGNTGWIAYGAPGGGGAPSTADYLTGTAQAGLSAEIVVGTTPGGELGGTWAAPTVDATHSGSAHTDFIAKAIVDIKGDIIAATAADTVARLAVGTDGQSPSGDAGAASGISWQNVCGSGTLAARPAAATNLTGRFYYATDARVLYECTGAAWQAVSIIGGAASITAQVAIPAGSVADVSLVSFTIPANFLAVGSTFRLHARGNYDNPSDATPTSASWKVKIGGTVAQTLTGATPPASTAQTNKPWVVDAIFVVRSTGAGGTCIAEIDGRDAIGSVLGTELAFGYGVATTAVDTTASKLLELTMNHGETTAGYVGRCDIATIELVKP